VGRQAGIKNGIHLFIYSFNQSYLKKSKKLTEISSPVYLLSHSLLVFRSNESSTYVLDNREVSRQESDESKPRKVIEDHGVKHSTAQHSTSSRGGDIDKASINFTTPHRSLNTPSPSPPLSPLSTQPSPPSPNTQKDAKPRHTS
jgi:hypothetical protein